MEFVLGLPIKYSEKSKKLKLEILLLISSPKSGFEIKIRISNLNFLFFSEYFIGKMIVINGIQYTNDP